MAVDRTETRGQVDRLGYRMWRKTARVRVWKRLTLARKMVRGGLRRPEPEFGTLLYYSNGV